jgi:glycosyltransferase involved in cell wall biosynthesis
VQELRLGDGALPGFIADDDLAALYSAADFFAYPSLYEGFGLPILEALACGRQCSRRTTPVSPRRAAPAHSMFTPKMWSSIAAGLVRLATDNSLAAELRSAGMAHAATFTWERSAQQLLAAYQQTLSM